MGKNRPPKKVRELLVELERRRRELLLGGDAPDLAERLRRLTASCEPNEYERFEVEAKELLLSCPQERHCSAPADEGAWKTVCDIRAQTHVDRRKLVVSSGTHRPGERRPNKAERTVPILPEVSLAFAAAAAAGHKLHISPSLSADAPTNPRQQASAPLSRQHQGGVVLWIRSFDLRIYDNPALMHAVSLGCAVHLVFAWCEEEDLEQGCWGLSGTAASLWLQHALAALDASYQRWYGHRISYIKAESTAAALQHAVREVGARAVVTSRAYDNAGRWADKQVEQRMCLEGVTFRSFNSFLLNDVENVRVDMSERRGHFGTLVPFLFACNAQPPPPKPQRAPAELGGGGLDMVPGNVALESLGLCRFPVRRDGAVLDWGAAIAEAWEITEDGAYAALQKFLSPEGGLSKYEAERHLADASAVARISPFLRFGMLSSRTVYWESMAAGAKDVSKTFWRRLVWRDLAYWQLRLFPSMATEPIRAHYAGQKWSADKVALRRWCQGRTGYPIVDAGMRELWATGWMAQNARMVAAVFLVEHLNIHWIEGARWFHHTLVDADPAINPMMWQNAGKSGLDQWNFTMHPSEFGRRMDPTGDYVRRWVPELVSLPARFIHCPWEAPERLQKHMTQGAYPLRSVENIDAAALASQTAIREQRACRRDRNDDGGYDTLVLPSGSSLAHDGKVVRLFTRSDYRLPLKAQAYDDPRSLGALGVEKRRPADFEVVLGDFMRSGA